MEGGVLCHGVSCVYVRVYACLPVINTTCSVTNVTLCHHIWLCYLLISNDNYLMLQNDIPSHVHVVYEGHLLSHVVAMLPSIRRPYSVLAIHVILRPQNQNQNQNQKYFIRP